MVQDLPPRYQWLLVSFTLHFAHRLSPRSFNRLMPLARATSLHLYTSPKNANRKTATAFPSFLLAQRSRGESHLLDERKNVDGICDGNRGRRNVLLRFGTTCVERGSGNCCANIARIFTALNSAEHVCGFASLLLGSNCTQHLRLCAREVYRSVSTART